MENAYFVHLIFVYVLNKAECIKTITFLFFLNSSNERESEDESRNVGTYQFLKWTCMFKSDLNLKKIVW